MGHVLNRLKKISPVHFPFFAASKALRSARTMVEKRIYRYEASPAKSKKAFTPHLLPLCHADATTPGFSGLFQEKFPDLFRETLSRADDALNLVVDVLGSGPLDLKAFRDRSDLQFLSSGGLVEHARVQGRIPWHFDIKAGLGWSPKMFWADIRPDLTRGADIKVPWELSRGASLLALGQGFRLTQEEKYAQAFVNQVEDWIRQNPTKFGVNWACPMDVAIRAANWIAAWSLLSGAAALTPEFNEAFIQSIENHRVHVRSHLEWSADVSTNHLLANLAGLFYMEFFLEGAAAAFPVFIRFTKELDRQLFPDGFCYEASTSYHHLDYEMALHLWILGKRIYSGREGAKPAELKNLSRILERMGAWFVRLGGKNGMGPLVGDNDSGRFHEWDKKKDGDVRFAANALALLTKNAEFKRSGWENTPSLVWLTGFSGWETLRALPANGKNVYEGKTSSSFLRMRGKKCFFIMNVLPNGTRGVGNHTHNDKLSLLFETGGEWYLTDPGMPAYTGDPAARNAFRATRAHSTVELDGEEQNRFVSDSLFTLENDARVVVEKVSDVEIQAAHTGYARGGEPAVHRRKLVRGKKENVWLLEDSFEAKGNHRFLWSFPAGPGIQIEQVDETRFQLLGKTGILLIDALNPDLNSWVEETGFSPAYGVSQTSMVLRFKTAGRDFFQAGFNLTWIKKDD